MTSPVKTKAQEQVEFLEEWHDCMFKMASRVYIPGYDLDDLIQELQMATIEHWDKYDPARGAKRITPTLYLWRTVLDHLVVNNTGRAGRSGVTYIEETNPEGRVLLFDTKEDAVSYAESIKLDSSERRIVKDKGEMFRLQRRHNGPVVLEYNDELDIVMLDDLLTKDLTVGLENLHLSEKEEVSRVEKGIILLLKEGYSLSEAREMLKVKGNKEWNAAIRDLQVAFASLAPANFKFSVSQIKKMSAYEANMGTV